MCKNCELKPVYILQNDRKLCKACFIRYFERKVRRTIRKYKLVEKKDKVVVACSGGKNSTSILSILNEISKNTKQFSISAVSIDECIKNSRKKILDSIGKLCKKNDICFEIISFEDYFDSNLDKLMKKVRVKNKKLSECDVCSILKRRILNDYCVKVKADKLCTGHNMDDEAQSILINQFRKNTECGVRSGPITGIKKNKKTVRRIKPLYFITEKETLLYSKLKGFDTKELVCPYSSSSYKNSVKKVLNDFEKKYQGTKNSIISSFLEIMPLLKKEFKCSKINYCIKCGEPTLRKKCQICELLK